MLPPSSPLHSPRLICPSLPPSCFPSFSHQALQGEEETKMQYHGEANICSEVSPTVLTGKRTKRRHRTLRPPPSVVISNAATSSASSSESMSAATEQDEDMANCLILLARGGALGPPPVEEKFTECTTAMTCKEGFYVYECKTCNKRFRSFQALGGHRTSHKKPKITIIKISKASSMMKPIVIHNNSNNSKNKLKVHECSICGSEFPSGQALGGHMRRHRMAAISHDQSHKGRSFLSTLDLNLPAPCDDFESLPLGLTFAGEPPFSAGIARSGRLPFLMQKNSCTTR